MEPKPFFRSPRSKLPWSIQEVGEDQRGGSKRIDFPRDTYNIHCLTSVGFLKQSVPQSDQIATEKK